MIDITTEIWRLKKNINYKVDQKASLQYSFRKLENKLKELGYTCLDLSGEKYDEGMSAKVVYKEDMSDDTEVIIVETVLPTIFYENMVIRNGEIIVGNKRGVE